MLSDLNKCKRALLERVPRFARKVQPVYKLLNWRLYLNRRSHGECCIPSAKDIGDILRVLIARIGIGDTTDTASYGLNVRVKAIPPNSKHLASSMWLQIEDSGERCKVKRHPKIGKPRCYWRKVSRRTERRTSK